MHTSDIGWEVTFVLPLNLLQVSQLLFCAHLDRNLEHHHKERRKISAGVLPAFSVFFVLKGETSLFFLFLSLSALRLFGTLEEEPFGSLSLTDRQRQPKSVSIAPRGDWKGRQGGRKEGGA